MDRLDELKSQDITDQLRQDRIGDLRQDRLEGLLNNERLNAPSSPSTSTATFSDPSSPPRSPSPTGSNDSSETIKAYTTSDNKLKYAIYRKK